MVEAADVFNASQYRRTIGGIGKSLGSPRISIVALSGVNAEVVVTVAWDISWYQYRISPDSDNPVRLEGRGHDPAELEGRRHRRGTPRWRTTAASCRTSPGCRSWTFRGWRPPIRLVH